MKTSLSAPPLSIQKRARLVTFSFALALFTLARFLPTARAQVTLYTDEPSFNAATASLQFVEDTFEGVAPAGGKVDFYDSSLNVPDAPITYQAHNRLAGPDVHGIYIADPGYDYTGALSSLNGTASLVAFFDIEDAPTTVTMFFTQPATAFGLDLGLVIPEAPDDPRSVYPHTDGMDIQLYAKSPDPYADVAIYPVGDVYHAGFLSKGFAGFVSTVPIVMATIVQVHPQDYFDQYGNIIEDYYQMVFDNVRIGQASTLPTVTVVGSDPNAEFSPLKDGAFVVTLSAAAATDLQVAYTVKGSAAPGTHYKKLPGTVTIPAGTTSAKIKIKPKDDPDGGTKVVKLTLQAGTGYIVGTPDPVKVKIKP